MIVYLERGFKCYVAQAETGTLWGFVALKPGHPYHGRSPSELPIRGLSWTSTAENLARVRTLDKPEGRIGSRGDWIIGFDSESSERLVREALACLTAMLGKAARRLPPAFMVEEFRDAVMPEVVTSGDDSPEHRREAWIAFVEIAISNRAITEDQAVKMHEPRGLTTWNASEFR